MIIVCRLELMQDITHTLRVLDLIRIFTRRTVGTKLQREDIVHSRMLIAKLAHSVRWVTLESNVESLN